MVRKVGSQMRRLGRKACACDRRERRMGRGDERERRRGETNLVVGGMKANTVCV